MAKELSADNFDETIDGNTVVFVDFWAPWCGPCKQMSPVIDQLSDEMDDVVVAKVNVDDNRELAERFGVMSIPTYLVFKGGEVVKQFAGAMSKEALKTQLEKFL